MLLNQVTKVLPRRFSEKFLGQGYENFPRIRVMRNSLELVLINSREIISRKSTALPLYGVHRCSSQEFLFLRKFSKISQISVDIFVGLSRDRFLGFFADSWERFLRISADYPQNCYLRSALFCLYLYCTACSGQLKSGPVLEMNGISLQ